MLSIFALLTVFAAPIRTPSTFTFEAEDAPTNGRVVRLVGLPKPNQITPEIEAAGRGYVELSQTGQSVEFAVGAPAQGLVIRHCIPDAPEGGGQSATLGLYVNGQRRQTLTLNSRYNWLYGEGKPAENGQSNTPSAWPHVFWDETAYRLDTPLARGDKLALRRDAEDTAAYYRIDLVEPEPFGAPLAQPAGSLSITDFGATGRDAEADTKALERCVEQAKAEGKSVWLPPGTWLNLRRVTLDSVKVDGAGMWHTKLLLTAPAARGPFGGYGGFALKGNGPQVRDLTIEALDCTRRGDTASAFIGLANDYVVERVWMTHVHCGFWIAGERGTIRDCRVRQTYADGINVNNGKNLTTRDTLVAGCHVRGTGDDGIAVLSNASSPNLTERVTVTLNTVVAPWWGHGCDIAGGRGHLVERNTFADGYMSPFTVNLPGAYPMHPLSDTVIRDNRILRGGSNFAGQRRGAMWLYAGSTGVDNLTLADNTIAGALFRGIHFTGGHPQTALIRRNRIQAPGQEAIHIDDKAVGAATLEANEVTDLPAGARDIGNDSHTFTVTETKPFSAR
ncbi:MAG: right-handed parallel beta-helix repeat-containing protein [Armatimonadetes bacterium]|nr:right-handed parallel beta-helix repeat-containing protein [Armatimonadota bacterium]